MSDRIAVLRSTSEDKENVIKEVSAMLDAETSEERDTYFQTLLEELDFENIGFLGDEGTQVLDSEGKYTGDVQEGDVLAWWNQDEDSYTRFDMDGTDTDEDEPEDEGEDDTEEDDEKESDELESGVDHGGSETP